MSMRFLLAAVPILLLAVACGGGDGDRDLVKNADGLYVIERLDFEGRELTLADGFNPALAEQYPNVIVRVNDMEIPAVDLAVSLVGLELSRREALEAHEILQESMLEEIDAVDPLEQLVDIQLLALAAEHLGYVPTLEEASKEATRVEAMYATAGTLADDMAKINRARGWPIVDWAESDAVIEAFQRHGGVMSVQLEVCDGPVVNWSNSLIIHDCAEFLAGERENAEIEYFVVWAE